MAVDATKLFGMSGCEQRFANCNGSFSTPSVSDSVILQVVSRCSSLRRCRLNSIICWLNWTQVRMRLKVEMHCFRTGIEILDCCDKYVLMDDGITLIT